MNPRQKTISESHRGFSLIELLVVIAVIALLSVFTLAALPSLLTARGITKGSSLVENSIRLARETALNSSRRTAVIIRSSGGRPYGRLAVYRATTNPAANWEPVGRWIDLPDGVVLDNAYAPTNALALTAASSAVASPPGIVDNGTTLSGTEYFQIVFGANGFLQSSGNIELRTLRGSYSSGSLAVTGGTPPKNWRNLVVISPFGRVKEITPEDLP